MEKLAEKLGKLRRNEEQMTPAQKKQYAKNLQALKRQICAGASEVLKEWCFGCLQVIKTDQKGIDFILLKGQMIVDEERKKGEMKRLGRILFSTYSVDSFLNAGCRLRDRIWFEAYGPYWLSRCEWNEEKKTWWNSIIGMWWRPEYCEWVSDNESKWTIMLPPTRELLLKQYREGKANYEGLEKQRGLL